jgi:hypothetical protein
MSIKKELQDSDLPIELQKLIQRVARRTRLRRSEQLDVARELITHFEDAIESGESPSNVIVAYGDEKNAAKLLRKACKRKRWWVEIAFVKSVKYAAMGFGGFIFVYLVMVFFALQRKPNIKVDYVTKMNEVAAAIPTEERAWPLYRAAAIAINTNPEPTPEVEERFVYPNWPGEAGWDSYSDWIDSHSKTLDLIREGAMKKGMGYLVAHAIAEEDKALWPEEYENAQDKLDNPFIGIWFPQLGHVRNMVILLKFDAIEAAWAGDGERCYQNIDAMIRLGTHTREHSSLINDLVAMSIYNLAFQTLGKILEHTPEIIQIEKTYAMLSEMDGEFNVRFDGERMFILDFLQRTYTDDGQGDGNLIPGKMIEMMSLMLDDPTSFGSIVFLAPLGDIFIASRKEFLDHYDGYLALMESYRDVPLYQWDDAVLAYDTKIAEAINEMFFSKYYFLDLIMPVLDRAMLSGKYSRARRDALLATLYAVEVQQTTGIWPVDLAQANVVDPWTGDSWLIANIEEQPVIYSAGCDGDDDGGTYTKNSYKWGSNPDKIDGDWVVWPSPE